MKTVYVIGAGASREANLPMGDELKGQIAKLLYIKHGYESQQGGNQALWRTFARHYSGCREELEKLNASCIHISKNLKLAISIDNFLDTAPDDRELALCGKIGIFHSILKAEKSSLFYAENSSYDDLVGRTAIQESWYLPFFQRLFEGCQRENLAHRLQQVTLIIFNYDRCIEHFLFHAIRSHFRLCEQDCAELINSNLQIVHPYGVVGALPWQNNEEYSAIEFGKQLNYDDILKHAPMIRTFSESANIGSEIRHGIVTSMREAQRLVFLGFAYHKMNMELLANSNDEHYTPPQSVTCIGTTYNFSENDQRFIKNDVSRLYNSKPLMTFEDVTCTELFLRNSRALSFR